MRKGPAGEEVACGHLEARGYTILARNFRCRRGEVDIVVRSGDIVVFVEVKTWDYHGIDSLEWAVGKEKQRRILAVSRRYLSLHPELSGLKLRFDVILVHGGLKEVEHLEDAFGAEHG